MNAISSRRQFLVRSSTATLGLLGLLYSRLACAFSLVWNENAFGSTTASAAIEAAGYGSAVDHPGLVLTAPELAENGAVVPIEVESRIPGTQSIALFVDANPNPMVAEFVFTADTPPYVSTRIKMASTSLVRVLAKTSSGVWQASQPVKVTLGGCGG